MNTPVNFELAKLLKEKGYNNLCNHLYFDGELKEITVEKVSYDVIVSSRYYIAPTIAEVVMWLYEEHGIWIYVSKPDENGWVIHWQGLKSYPTLIYFSSPTEAYEAAIEYTLKNLI